MKAIVLDTETTGVETTDRVIEVAYVELNDKFKEASKFHSYYNPLMPIGLGAMATHNIVNSDLTDAPPYTDFVLPDVDYVIGHNIDFDLRMVGHEDNDDVKRICTLAVARRWLPDIGTHKQSALLYYFFGEAARDMVKDAHSAMADVLNCIEVLGKLQGVMREGGAVVDTLEQLWEESERCRIPVKISFGKHEGTPIKDLPWSYKSWLLAQDWLDKYLRVAVTASM